MKCRNIEWPKVYKCTSVQSCDHTTQQNEISEGKCHNNHAQCMIINLPMPMQSTVLKNMMNVIK